MTTDQGIVDHMAMIGLSAGIRIVHCTDAGQLPAGRGAGPVLWGADTAPALELDPKLPGDLLLGGSAQADAMWLVASRRPELRVALLPHASNWLGEYLGQWALRAGHGHTLAFSALAGGIGTSALACLMAHAGTLSGLRSVVVDVDPYSSSLWPMLAWQAPAGIGWEELEYSGGQLAPHQFQEALPVLEGSSVLSWQKLPGSFSFDEQLLVRVLTAARQGFDLVVLDLGRHSHPLTGAISQFVDQFVATCTATTLERAAASGLPHILCGAARVSTGSPPAAGALVGQYPALARIDKCITNGELFHALRSRRLRQLLADYCLLPDDLGQAT